MLAAFRSQVRTRCLRCLPSHRLAQRPPKHPDSVGSPARPHDAAVLDTVSLGTRTTPVDSAHPLHVEARCCPGTLFRLLHAAPTPTIVVDHGREVVLEPALPLSRRLGDHQDDADSHSSCALIPPQLRTLQPPIVDGPCRLLYSVHALPLPLRHASAPCSAEAVSVHARRWSSDRQLMSRELHLKRLGFVLTYSEYYYNWVSGHHPAVQGL